MSDWTYQEQPDDLREVDARLRAQAHDPTRLQMDELKRRTLTRWQSGHTGHKRRSRVRARVLTLLLITGFALTGGGAAVLAAKGGNPGAKKNENAGNSQYRPGKGCGDKNRPHTGPPGNLSNKDCPPQAK